MIVVDLNCANRHQFEGWFASSEEFHRQAETRLITCPTCGDDGITRLPSGPHVRRAGTTEPAPSGRDAIAALALRCEDVGESFPEEARKIHYEQVPARSIRGIATLGEVKSLVEEGIPVLPLPAKDEAH